MTISNTQLAADLQQVTLGFQSFTDETINWLTSTDPTVTLTDPYTLVAKTVKTPYQLQLDYDSTVGNASGELAQATTLLNDATTLYNNAVTYDVTFSGYLVTAEAHKNAAATSETNAASHDSDAAASAAAALASEIAAAASEANAATSETNAAASATSANTSSVAAATSATNAAASESTVAADAAAASTSAAGAASSATSASTSATNAATSETNAAASETNAATSATNAASSASSASTSASNAATSETNASTSETNAASSASAAATSETNAAASAASAPSLSANETVTGDWVFSGGLDINSGTGHTLLTLTQTGTIPTTWELKNNATTGRFTIGVAGSSPSLKMETGTQNNLFRLGQDISSATALDTVSVGGTVSGQEAVLNVSGILDVTDPGTGTTALFNKTGTSGNIFSAQKSGVDKFEIQNDGTVHVEDIFKVNVDNIQDDELSLTVTPTSFALNRQVSSFGLQVLTYDTTFNTIHLHEKAKLSGGLEITAGTAPSSATATGTAGEVRFDSNYMYRCVATNTWKRVALSTWT